MFNILLRFIDFNEAIIIMCCINFGKKMLLFSLTFAVGICFSIFFDSSKDESLLNVKKEFAAKSSENTERQISESSDLRKCRDNSHLLVPLIQKQAEIESQLRFDNGLVEEKAKQKIQLMKLKKAIAEIERQSRISVEIIRPTKNGLSDLLYREGCPNF